MVAGDFVSMEDGTGIVHLAPGVRAPDLAVGRAQGWPVFKPVGDDGRFTDQAPEFVRGTVRQGRRPARSSSDLRERGVLFREETYEHNYPFCWRCQTPLLYYARTSWYARTTAVKDRLLAVNDDVELVPRPHQGRPLRELAREQRGLGALARALLGHTPADLALHPRPRAGHRLAPPNSGELAGRDVSDVDPHRPAIDDVTFPCVECGETATRVSEVIDTWYDSGAMPFAQWGYHPELGRGEAEFAAHFPADFISEAIDQTRGWFYTLMAEGVLHFDETAYRNVVCLGHLIAEDGKKMSKSLGNMFDPWEALDRQGADALRWFMLTNGSPWASRRIGHDVLDDVLRRFLLTLWNVYSFFVTYANAEGFDPARRRRPPVRRTSAARSLGAVAARAHGRRGPRRPRCLRRHRRGPRDRGVRRRPVQLVRAPIPAPVLEPGRLRWTRLRSRPSTRCTSVSVTVATLLAPFTPFVSEALWQNLAAGREGRPDSVHLADYPAARRCRAR